MEGRSIEAVIRALNAAWLEEAHRVVLHLQAQARHGDRKSKR